MDICDSNSRSNICSSDTYRYIMKVKKQTIELLKKGNVAYPKATFLNIYDAILYLASEIDKLKENDLKLVGAVKVCAGEIDDRKHNEVLLEKAIETCAEDLDKIQEGDAVDGMSIDDVFAATHPGDSTAFAIKNISKGQRWGIGQKDADGNWGMNFGPCITEKECLNAHGSKGDCILLLTGESQMIKHRWESIGWVNQTSGIITQPE